ncbi:MAG: hypothetical protein R3Y35_14540 [Clostridia bacterium]
MEILISIAVIFLSFAIFLAFGVSIKDFRKLIDNAQDSTNKSLKNIVNQKENKLIKFLRESEQMLKVTGQGGKFSFMIILSVCLILLGISTSIAIGNLYLIPVASIAFGIIPFLYIRFQYIEYNKFVLEGLSVAMSQVTTSYERTENILLSFKENVDDVKEPVKTIFLEFINEIENINPNYEKAIDNMKNKIDNSVWVEWCEAIKRCSRNRTLKYVLAPIVTKLSKVKVVTGELKTILSNATKNFWILMCAALALLYVGVYILPDGLMIDIPTNLRNMLIALNVSVSVFAGIKVALISNEIKFDL